MLYESKGIPRCHIICVMRLQHVDSFPVSLICNRWLKDVKSSAISGYKLENMNNDMMITTRFGALVAFYNKFCHIATRKHEVFNFVRDEILNLIDKLKKQGDSILVNVFLKTISVIQIW